MLQSKELSTRSLWGSIGTLSLVGLILFPLISVAWEFSFLFGNEVHSGPISLTTFWMKAADAGGQGVVAGSLLRLALVVASGLALLFPSHQASVGEGGRVFLALFLFWGFLSSVLAPHQFQALDSWLDWSLPLLLATTTVPLAIRTRPGWVLASLYLLSLALAGHFFFLSVPASRLRVGGAFHHPNIMSTVCLLLLPMLLARALRGGPDRILGVALSGVYLSALVMTGSVTGTLLGVGAGLIGASGGWSWARRATLVVLSVLLLLLTSLEFPAYFGTVSVGLICGALLLCLSRSRWSTQRGLLAGMGLAFVLSLGLGHALKPPVGKGEVSSSRYNSVSGRFELYRVALVLTASNPSFGVGPGGFARYYPRYQRSVRYYSRFMHCLALEIACEWGIPALLWFALFHLLFLRECSRSEMTPQRTAALASVCLFWLHSSTGVQSQFPYLFVLLGVAYGFMLPEPTVAQPTVRGSVTRLSLAVLLCPVLSLSLATLGAAVAENLALSHQASGPTQSSRTEALYLEMLRLNPSSREAWRKVGMVMRGTGKTRLGLAAAKVCLELDPDSATCLYSVLDIGGRPYPQNLLDRALLCDPQNYPAFRLFRAENLVLQSEPEEALKQLNRLESSYSESLLEQIQPFRASDLRDQLVDCWVLRALLEESLDRSDDSLESFRRAVSTTEGRVDRILSIVAYPQEVSLEPGPVLALEFEKLREVLRRNNFPVSGP